MQQIYEKLLLSHEVWDGMAVDQHQIGIVWSVNEMKGWSLYLLFELIEFAHKNLMVIIFIITYVDPLQLL